MTHANYIRAALSRAHFYVDPIDGLVHGEIPGFNEVNAEGQTVLECRHALIELLEDWIEFHRMRGLGVPVLDGIELPVRDPY